MITSLGEEGAGCFASLWFISCVQSIIVSLVFLFMSLVGHVLLFSLSLDIFVTTLERSAEKLLEVLTSVTRETSSFILMQL